MFQSFREAPYCTDSTIAPRRSDADPCLRNRRGQGLYTTRSPIQLLADRDLPCGAHLAVQLLCIVGHRHGQLFFVAGEGQIVRYTPRVPAGARSAKGHDALGDHFAVGSGDDHLRIE